MGILFLFVLGGPAWAQPEYPIGEWCKQFERGVGGGFAVEAECRKNEKKAQQKVRLMGYTPERIAAWCDNVATQGTGSNGSYQVYFECVQDEFSGQGHSGQ